MKGILLCGGKGTRLMPLTKITNKHLLPIWNQPMAYWPLMTLRNSGIRDILLISGPEYLDGFIKYFENGEDFGVNIRYKVQKEPKGIADALRLAQDFVFDGYTYNPERIKFAVILGDNIFGEDFASEFNQFYLNTKDQAKIFLKKVNNWKDYGVAIIKNGKISKIIEKPKKYVSDYAVTGLYLYSGTVFEKLKELKPSKRGELEITDINNWYLKRKKLEYKILEDYWFDAGESLETYLKVNNFVSMNELEKVVGETDTNDSTLSKGFVKVYIDDEM